MKKTSIPILLVLYAMPLIGQQYKEIIRETFLDGEFFLMREEYPDALYEFKKVYDRGHKDNANVNYRIGICYLNIPGEKEKAIPYLEQALTDITPRYREGLFRETRAPYDAYLYLGNAYRINNELDKACSAYRKYIQLLDDPGSEETRYAEKQITCCRNARKEMSQPLYLWKKNAGPAINTKFSEFHPVLSHDENIMVYMSSLRFYDAVQYSVREKGQWTDPINITPQIQSDGNQYVSCLSPEGKFLLLSKEDQFDSDIYYSTYEKGRWSVSKPLGKEVNSRFWESHASLSPDGKTLYFASNRRGGIGEMDIYMSRKNTNGKWGEPLNLGGNINTELNEDHPFLSPDGNFLFFVSQGHYNIGGYDIFRSEKKPDGSWSEPVNLGYPLNTTGDDLFYFPAGAKNEAYLALFEDNNYGKQDIYKILAFDSEQACNKARESAEKPEVIEDEIEEIIEEAVEEAEQIEEEPAEEIPEREPVIIRPVFFGFDQFSLGPRTKEKLDDLAGIMEDHPEMVLAIRGHTDTKGPDAYNMQLSVKRAESVRNYLLGKGLSEKRLHVKGLGETKHIAINSNPDGTDNPHGRKLNRRVEFRVLQPELPYVKTPEPEVPDSLRYR